MKKKRMLLAACLLSAASWASAQVRVTGTVVSAEDGQPVVGASVIVPGTKVGGVTDMEDGKFTLRVPEGHKNIRVSSIGMEPQELSAKEHVKIVLQHNAKALDELVVVAYGTASRQSLTGAVASIDTKQIEQRPLTNAVNALEGAAPGIQINNSYGEPGSDKTSIRIRGFGSVNGSNDPLIVVDGAQYTGSMNDINPEDIASISVLKDASSAALYGNKAANGVILINTKKGSNNRLNVRASVKEGIYNRAIPDYDRLGINDWMETMLSGYKHYFIITVR